MTSSQIQLVGFLKDRAKEENIVLGGH